MDVNIQKLKEKIMELSDKEIIEMLSEIKLRRGFSLTVNIISESMIGLNITIGIGNTNENIKLISNGLSNKG